MQGKVETAAAWRQAPLHPRHQRADYLEGKVRVYSLAGVIVASISNPASQVGGSLLPDLYDAKLITMNEHGMLFKSEERPQGDAGPAYIQEWSVMVEKA